MSSPSASSVSSSPFVPARQSVRDLLAELSDSEPDTRTSLPSRIEKAVPVISAVEEESSEDDILVSRGGKLTRRLAGEAVKPVSEASSTPRDGEQHKHSSEESAAEGPRDQVFQPTRKLLLRKKITKTPEGSRVTNNAASRSLSPAASPFSSRSDKSSTSSTRPLPALTQKLTEAAESSSKSRFSALVEKARKQRLAREQEERAKKEAIKAQESLAASGSHKDSNDGLIDDSDADSDISDAAAAKRLTKNTRPTRKASKKALEEMNRETQRMNRNMQLAHQAKTKKKFTKESFFASFTHDLPVTRISQIQQNGTLSPESLSDNSTIEGEKSRYHSTPPTSPLPDSEEPKQKDTGSAASNSAPVSTAMKERSELVLPMEKVQQIPQDMNGTARKPMIGQTARMTIGHAEYDLSSDSELEVIADQASKRKYSAFENLPKKKSKEKPSHLALRSLANIRHEKSVKSSMTSADMGPILLRAARKQAQDERQVKIERLKAAGVIIQTVEEREKEEEVLEDLVEKARQEDEEIRRREKQIAKKNGTFQKDILDEEDSDEEDEDFEDQNTDDENTTSGSEDEAEKNNVDEVDDVQEADEGMKTDLIDDAAEESDDVSGDDKPDALKPEGEPLTVIVTPIISRTHRHKRVIEDDEDEPEAEQTSRTPFLPTVRKTPQSIVRSARNAIPGLQYSDDLPIGLTQAFAATMAESQTQGQVPGEQQIIDVLSGLPSPNIDMIPQLQRLDSVEVVAESVPGSQNQLLGLNLDLSQNQRVPESPAPTLQYPASQTFFELTQDMGYKFSPFAGSRYAETPGRQPHSTEETIILPQAENSPILQRQGHLRRGRQANEEEELPTPTAPESAFAVMSKAARRRVAEDFNRKRSEARQAVDEAAEESDDEYAGLGGASGEDSDEEANEDDRRMIDEDTQVGRGDEAKLAKLHADRERESDEAAVSKLLKDITTGALRRKRGAGDELELSDDEDNAARRRKAKQREFEKMRRALLKDEAIGKIAEDKRKEAFLKSIEDRDDADESENDLSDVESQQESGPQMLVDAGELEREGESQGISQNAAQPLQPSKDSQLNKFNFSGRRSKTLTSRKPATLAEIRESVSFLVEEPDSQAQTMDLGLSDSENEPEAYINLDRHFQQAEADENAENDDDAEDLGDFIVDDQPPESGSQDDIFKKPDLPRNQQSDRAPFSERRTKAANVIDRLSLLRQASSSTGTSNASSRMAFFTSKAVPGVSSNGPSLLRRATTNSSLGSLSGRDNVSATGVVTSKTERGSAKEEKEFVRKGNTTSRNAVNYQGRQNLKEEKMSARAGVNKRQQKKKGGSGFLSGLLRGDTWS